MDGTYSALWLVFTIQVAYIVIGLNIYDNIWTLTTYYYSDEWKLVSQSHLKIQ